MGGTNIFKVLADGQRREILMMLKDGRLNAGEISEKLQITPDRKSTRLNSSHTRLSRMPSSA